MLLFNILLFLLVEFLLSCVQLLSLICTRILFLPPDGTLKINKDNLCGLLIYFPELSISVIHSTKDWQEAINFSMASLLAKNYISENYIQAIKDSTISNGPYYILAPGVAMPHARPECGALKTGMSLTLLKQGVYFPGNDEPIKLLIGLSAADADSHIAAIQALSELLCEEEILEQLLTASSEKQLAGIISRG